ncbi:MAG: DEAD/DEAH box helicase [Kiritimatiellia bacterium]
MKLSPKQREALNLVADGKFVPALVREEDGWHARWRVLGADAGGVEGWVDEYIREFTLSRLSEDAEEQRHETLHDAWLLALRSRTGLVVWDDGECAAFAAELEAWSGNATEDRAARGRVAFTFSAGGTDAAAPQCEVTCEIPPGRNGLKALGQAAYVWRPLAGLRRLDAEPSRLGVRLTRQEAEDFLRRGAADLQAAGYPVVGVELQAAVTATAEIGDAGRDARPPPVALTVRVAGEAVTAEEIRFLLDQGSTLVYFRDRWIEVDRGILKEALRALEKGAGKQASPLAFALGIGHVGRLELEGAKTHGWLRGLVGELRASARRASGGVRPRQAIPGLNGTLRDYQLRGVEWLRFLTGHGFGALLADDMGLGKTVQVIAWLLLDREARRQAGDEAAARAPTLVVAPLTLLSNWQHEFVRFAPSLRVYVHQGGGRHVASGFRRAVEGADVTLTSYHLLVRDYGNVAEIAWAALVLDEAQAIKNPDTQVSRAVCALLPPKRIAMTGTPVENSVGDLWALEAFLNPGLLGERRAFAERFVRPIAADEQSSAGRRLRHALEPFLLRRLKSDRSIAAELGEKREIREYCLLTAEQRRAYEQALADFRVAERAQGDVFALLTQLKLICDGAGKLERLCELVETIFANGESVLVFTQYAKVGLWLQDELAKRFGRKFPFLHGALSASAREAQVRAFQASRRPTLFLLSLKAGGFGLNLTKATHVVHFDRWWNPAVENQATDRVHRIGQAKTVFVHLFICAGTLEEHVDDILRRKARVADSVVTEAEWLEAAKLDE